MNIQKKSGFTLIEVVVAMLIFMISAMGISGLVARNVQHEVEVEQRSQAFVLLQNMVDRVTANREAASCYSNSAGGLDLGTESGAIPACGVGTVAQKEQADADLLEWDLLLKGAAIKQGASMVGAISDARGCIRQVSSTPRVYRISVSWLGLGPTVAPADLCGKDSYGNEEYRRTLSAVVRFGDMK